MIEIAKAERGRLSELFQGYTWNYLPDAVLDGSTGKAFADDRHNPQVAALELPGVKLSIMGGDAGHPSARGYLERLPRIKLLLFASEGWEGLTRKTHRGRVFSIPRYAFSSEKLDIEHLRQFTSQVPDGFQLVRMDLDLARRLARDKGEFASSHLLNFDSPEDFIERGFGFCVLDGSEIVSVATTFAICDKGIEIQINTRENQRGKGLATAVAAHLLIHSLENGLDPNWDAENEKSSGLATKLGYTPQGTYPMFLCFRSRLLAAFVKFGLKVRARVEK